MTTYTRRLSAVTIALVATITVLSFVLSYAALVTVAMQVKPGWLAYLWPLIIDVPIVAFSVVALLAVTLHRSAIVPRLLVGLASAATVYFNYVATPQPQALIDAITFKAVAVSAPVMLLLSFEVLVWLLRIVAPQPDEVVTATSQQPDTQPQVQPDEVVTIASPQPVATPTQQRREAVLQMRKQGATLDDMAAWFGVAKSTISRDIKALNGKVR
jgi:hypothetical protein